MIDIVGRVRWIRDRANQIFDLVGAISRLSETGGTVTPTVINTEYDVYRVQTPKGVFKPLKVMLDFSLQTTAETVRVRVYYRITSGAGLVMKDEQIFSGVQTPEYIKNIELEPNRYGLQVTIERLGGTARNYAWMAAYEV